MIRLEDQLALVALMMECRTNVLDTSQHRLGRCSFMLVLITTQIARSRRGSVARMPGAGRSRTVIVKGAEFSIRSFCAVGAGGTFVSVAFDLSLLQRMSVKG